MTPKTCAVTLNFSRQWSLQATGGEVLLRQQLLGAVGKLLDESILAGSGASGQPTGIVNAANIGTQAGASFDHADAIAMRQTALTAGAREAAMQWIAAPAVQGLLAARERATGGGRFIWDGRSILDMPANATPTAPASTLILGDFSKLLLGVWGPPSLVLEVNPYQSFAAGIMAARCVLSCDVALPQPAAFVVASSVS